MSKKKVSQKKPTGLMERTIYEMASDEHGWRWDMPLDDDAILSMTPTDLAFLQAGIRSGFFVRVI